MLDIEREQDIERLRQLALLQKRQLELMVEVHARKCEELQSLKGNEGEPQLALTMLADTERQIDELEQVERGSTRGDGGGNGSESGEGPDAEKSRPRRGHGPTEQLTLERVKLCCELDHADQTCPQCGGGLQPMAGQAERSEMVDVVEVKYQVVEVERQKYVCRCGSAVETAPGPERAIDGGRYSLRFAIKVAFERADDPTERRRLRGIEARAVLEKMHTWMHQARALKTTSLGGAIRYTLRNWDRLTAFVDEPLVWGSKSARGTKAAAILYSLVESAKVGGIDPVAYLIEVATRARRTPGAVLLPADFAVECNASAAA